MRMKINNTLPQICNSPIVRIPLFISLITNLFIIDKPAGQAVAAVPTDKALHTLTLHHMTIKIHLQTPCQLKLVTTNHSHIIVTTSSSLQPNSHIHTI